EEEVVEHPVVEVPDRCRRPQERDDAALDKVAQHEHVVSLVGVPGGWGWEVDEAEDGGGDEDRAERDELDRSSPCLGHVGSTRARPPTFSPEATAATGSSATRRRAAVARDRLPRRLRAPGGRGSSGSPRARATARPRLIAS